MNFGLEESAVVHMSLFIGIRSKFNGKYRIWQAAFLSLEVFVSAQIKGAHF